MNTTQPIGMSHPGRWLALLRILVGLYFAKALWYKMTIGLAGGFLPLPMASDRWIASMPMIVTKQAAGNPIEWYKAFLDNTVLTNVPLFAQMTAWGESVAGVGLVLGLWSGVAGLVALSLAINYGLATGWMSPGQVGFHYVLISCLVVFILARSGREWGLDGWMAWRWGDKWFTRRPFA
ncbi:MAG: TQO small subunit DoxD [Gemmatimonadota bacterium]